MCFHKLLFSTLYSLRSKMECSILEGPDVFSKATNFQNIATSASEARNVQHLGRLRCVFPIYYSQKYCSKRQCSILEGSDVFSQATIFLHLFQVTIAEFASKDGNLFDTLEMIPVFGTKLPIIQQVPMSTEIRNGGHLVMMVNGLSILKKQFLVMTSFSLPQVTAQTG